MSIAAHPTEPISYPESDGQPMAENTEQFRWIVTVKENLEVLFRDAPQVFVAGDLLWYPVEGRPDIRRAPDTMVVFGRPKGRRGAYLQWREDGLAPQVVFEILSPGNSLKEMAQKFEFYDTHGVEEYYLYDPDSNDLNGWQRQGGRLRTIAEMHAWVSPRLGIRFEHRLADLVIYYPDGQPFLSFVEMERRARSAEERITTAEQRITTAEERATTAEQEAQQARRRAEQLAARLRALGIDPDSTE
ncbi:MAG: Uma2 family endonuclease [Chloroflexaceae bacterium]|nr:Uma2 family endonuclease [Chloroflexaceae bacterium]